MDRAALVADLIAADLAHELDDHVHDLLDEDIHGPAASRRASAINNNGPEAQVDFLLEQGWALPDLVTLFTTTPCKFCGAQRLLSAVRYHQGGPVGLCCWDDRLLTTA